ncbi:glycosyltransferase [Paenibacillus sp. GCM10027626]|uniref:GAP1-N2 domain-containing protein n=1 Tax=Paenibacillus sp. GCM10027626 TaxID=3273411 RepID=UPI003625A732
MRDSKPGRMIQQQMYARERRGIFRSAEGYDTIAKSGGLDPSFIKKVLHPLCIYDAPTELAARGEKDGAAYPETMHLLHLDNGDIVLGCSIYQAADFTGLRSAFFTHNYIIPSGHESESDNDYENWLQAFFADSYDIDNGTEIAELANLPIQPGAAAKLPYRSLLAQLNIGEKPFKQLLYAVMAAVGGKKKIYVALDVPIAQLSIKAKQLLALLYASLPYAYRKQLGFITYAKEPQSRKSVHLTFVEQGSLRPGDRSIEKDYTFDFVNDRIMNVDLESMDQPYLDFAWDNLDRPERADSFFQFAEVMLEDMGPERRIAAASYHELCVIYQIEEGNDTLYETHKTAVLRGLLDYLQPSGSLDSKNRLNDLFLSRFDYEFDRVRQGQMPEPFIVDFFKDYYRIDGKNIKSKLVSFFILALNNANMQNEQELAASFYAAVESNPDLSKTFFAKLLTDSRIAASLFVPFLEKKLTAAAGAKSVLQLIEQWGNAHPGLFGYESFHTLACEQLMEKLAGERHSIAAAGKVFEQLRRLKEEARSGIEKQPLSHDDIYFYQDMEFEVYRAMLTGLDLDKLSKDQLASAEFLQHKDQLKRWNGQLQDTRQKSAAFELFALYEWFALPEPTAELFSLLSPEETDRVQQVGRRLLAGQLEPAGYPRLSLAFLRSSDMETVDYAKLLDYLQQNASNKMTVYRFFQWSEKHPDFMRPRGFVPAYSTAIVGYFKKYDRNAFKKRANRKQLLDRAGATLTAVYKQAERELSSPIAKFFRRNRKMTMITTIIALGITLVVAGLISLSGKDDTNQESSALPEVKPSAEPDIVQPNTLVYVEQTPASGGQAATTSLVFLFKDAAACTRFAPSSITIESPGVEAVEYTKLAFFPVCSADAADDNTEGNQVGVSALPTGSADAPVTESATPPATTPAETPDATSSEKSDTPNNRVSESGSSTGTGSGPEQSGNVAAEQEGYTSRVVVRLDKQADIPANSVIRAGEVKYKLSVLHKVNK